MMAMVMSIGMFDVNRICKSWDVCGRFQCLDDNARDPAEILLGSKVPSRGAVVGKRTS